MVIVNAISNPTGFCSENDWKRAYNEINEFEKELSDWGAIIIKFWVHIDKDTQLQRFTDRQNNPEKQWKITDEDWRNREKWDLYEDAIDEMLQKTSTTFLYINNSRTEAVLLLLFSFYRITFPV